MEIEWSNIDFHQKRCFALELCRFNCKLMYKDIEIMYKGIRLSIIFLILILNENTNTFLEIILKICQYYLRWRTFKISKIMKWENILCLKKKTTFGL